MAETLRRVTGVAAPLLRANIDTDTISPGSRTAKRGQKQEFSEKGSSTLAADLFANWRYDAEGEVLPDFVLNRPAFRAAKILIAGDNFGCGSSRETAVWMLKEWGIRCILAPSFGEIFYGSCFKNAVLPAILPEDEIRALADEAAQGGVFDVDIETQRISTPNGRIVPLRVPEFLRRGLLDGLDEIDVTLQRDADIAAFYAAAKAERPWIYRPSAARTAASAK
jgi:3-isopropylmalate/(R)-2-methylmalate dehydratase small subunit